MQSVNNHVLIQISECDEEQEESQESSKSISSKIDDLGETLERKFQVKSGTSRVMRCVGGFLKTLIKRFVWWKNKDHED